jgi:hypothetical protein
VATDAEMATNPAWEVALRAAREEIAAYELGNVELRLGLYEI